MEKINYRYEVGDTVIFKSSFVRPSCGLVGREGTVAKISGKALAYNNKPHYYLDGDDTVCYHENLFAGRYEDNV